MKKLILSNIPKLPFDMQEALTQFRLNLGFCGSEVKVIMITSSTPNEGKSFLALHLWKMIAELGSPALYIDADFRNSQIRAKYAMTTETGEQIIGGGSFLSGSAELGDVLYQTNIPQGYMIPVVNNIANPAMLLNSARFGKMIQALSRAYRYIIVDTPPLSNVADALSIAPWCDGSVLVVRSGATPRKIVDDSLLALKRTGKPFLGFVLNRVEDGDKTSVYYRRHYHSNYRYYNHYKNKNYSDSYGYNGYYGKNKQTEAK